MDVHALMQVQDDKAAESHRLPVSLMQRYRIVFVRYEKRWDRFAARGNARSQVCVRGR